MSALAGMGLGIVGVVAGAAVLVAAGGTVSANYILDAPELNAFGIGIPALALGPLAYFLGKGRGTEIVGIAATVIGAASTLVWLVIMLLGYFGSPPAS